MKTTQRLLSATKDIWAAYNEHPFVLGIQEGTLARDYSEQQLQHLTDVFVACSRYEMAFWEMAWNMSK